MSESNDGAASFVSVDRRNVRRNQGSNSSTRKSNKKFQRKKKKGIPNHTMRIQGATPELKGFCNTTHEDVSGKTMSYTRILKRHQKGMP